MNDPVSATSKRHTGFLKTHSPTHLKRQNDVLHGNMNMD